MYQFNVPDMTCGHCASTITKAVKSEDPDAKVEISLSNHLVKVALTSPVYFGPADVPTTLMATAATEGGPRRARRGA